jgi:flagellar hook-length control protein FliK
MEQGRWQVQFQITPEKLGPVDVHLQLHDHKLHAQFYTSNAYTQTLLQESMHKLRETVENSGIELANAWVHGGEKHHHRENPAHDQSNTTKTQTILNPNEAPKEDMKPLIPLDARNNKNPSKRVVDLFI